MFLSIKPLFGIAELQGSLRDRVPLRGEDVMVVLDVRFQPRSCDGKSLLDLHPKRG